MDGLITGIYAIVGTVMAIWAVLGAAVMFEYMMADIFNPNEMVQLNII